MNLSIVFCSLLIVVLWGCSHIRLQTSPRIDSESWQQYGGTMQRTNTAISAISPPLDSVWTYETNGGFSEYSGAIADSLLFIGNLKGEIHIVSLRNGQSVGSYGFGASISGTPVIDGAIMYVALSNEQESVIAFDLTQGIIIWKARIGGVESSLLMVNDKLFAASVNGVIVSLNKTTGKELWRYILPGKKYSTMIHSSPASDGDVLVFGCDDGSMICLDYITGKLVWQTKTGKSVFATSTISAGTVFFGSQDEYYYALNLKTGAVTWKQYVGARIFSSQAVNEQFVYFGTAAGVFYCLSKTDGSIVWKQKVESVIASAPLISGTTVYVGSLDRNLYAFSSGDGQLLWKFPTEGRIKTAPVAWKDFLIIQEDNRVVVAFKPGVKK